MGIVGILRYPGAAPARQDILRQVQPLPAFVQVLKPVGMKLIDRVDAQQLNASQFPQFFRADPPMQRTLRLYATLVAIAERISKRLTFGIEPHVINSPAVNCNGANTLRR